jgi:Fe-S-cluster-containing hydrogenase component 2
MIRSGVVKEMVTEKAASRVASFLRDNSSFGEQTILGEATWPSSMVAMTRVDVVRIPRKHFDEILAVDRVSATQLRGRVEILESQRLGQAGAAGIADLSKTTAMDLMVGKQAVKGGEALLIDLNRCTRCNACVEACVSVHEDKVPRLSKRGIRAGDMMLTSACYNCTIPECMMGCNYGAIRRDVNGAIHIILSNCTGCSACEIKCPYGVIRMASMLDPAEKEEETRGFFSRMFPFLRGRPEAIESQKEEADVAPAKAKVEKKAIKCDLCAGLPFEACVYNCPCSAISRVDPAQIVGM